MKRLRKRQDYVDSIIRYWKSYFGDSFTIFRLQQRMLEMGICPRCGTPSSCWSSTTGNFPCWECNFYITENEIGKVLDEEYPRKYILNKRLKEKRK